MVKATELDSFREDMLEEMGRLRAENERFKAERVKLWQAADILESEVRENKELCKENDRLRYTAEGLALELGRHINREIGQRAFTEELLTASEQALVKTERVQGTL